jgi:hypothetical protein
MKMQATCFSETSIHFSILNMKVVVSPETFACSSVLESHAEVSYVILSTLVYPEDGGNRFLRNICALLYPKDGDAGLSENLARNVMEEAAGSSDSRPISLRSVACYSGLLSKFSFSSVCPGLLGTLGYVTTGN